jgi:hypothetical protein
MPRTRWLVIGALLVAAVMGTALEARGPFGAHPTVAYDQFLADVQAGKVDRIVQWRDRLEVTERGAPLSVIVPAERDLQADLAQARRAGGVGIDLAWMPDAWLGMMTPAVPVVLVLVACFVWLAAIVEDRRSTSGSGLAGEPGSTA